MKDWDTMTVSKVGQSTLPKWWRQASGLSQGGVVEVHPMRDGKNSIVLTPRPGKRRGDNEALSASHDADRKNRPAYEDVGESHVANTVRSNFLDSFVIPAQAGIHRSTDWGAVEWVPACAGTTIQFARLGGCRSTGAAALR